MECSHIMEWRPWEAAWLNEVCTKAKCTRMCQSCMILMVVWVAPMNTARKRNGVSQWQHNWSFLKKINESILQTVTIVQCLGDKQGAGLLPGRGTHPSQGKACPATQPRCWTAFGKYLWKDREESTQSIFRAGCDFITFSQMFSVQNGRAVEFYRTELSFWNK